MLIMVYRCLNQICLNLSYLIDKIGQAIEKLFRYSLLGLYYSLHGTVRIIL